MLMVLHTWGQKLEHHPHVHCVVPGGGLAMPVKSSGSTATVPGYEVPRWVSCRPNWFLPVRVLGRVFRGKYLAALRRLPSRPTPVRGSTLPLANPAAWATSIRALYQKDWVVYAKEPFGGPEQVLKYLTGYTHRVALSNHRLVKLEDGRVTFIWKDYADGCRRKEMTLEAVEFVRRFAAHHTQGVGTDSAVWTLGPPRSRGAVSVVPVAAGGRGRTVTGTRDRLAAAECQCRIDGQRPVTEWGGAGAVSGRAQVGSAISDRYLHTGGLGFAPGRIGGHDLVRLIPGCAASRGSGRRSLSGLWCGSPTNDLASRPARPENANALPFWTVHDPMHPKRRLLLNRHPRRPGPATDSPCGASAVIGHPLTIVTIGSIPAIFISASDPWPYLVAASGCYPRASVHVGSTC